MTGTRLPSLDKAWVLGAVGLTGALAGAVAIVGLVVLPLAQTNVKFAGVWDAICSAAGVPRARLAGAPAAPTIKTSNVIVTSLMLGHPSALSIGRGATLAQQCAICHGSDGISRADFPNLAGQYAGVIFKELEDFRSGARTNAVMGPFAMALGKQDVLDLAAFYSYLPRIPGYHPEDRGAAPRIVVNGAPMRNIPPCGACHGALDNKAGAPWLEGQSAVYIEAQLQAFTTAGRHNDISAQMRNVARRMSATEIHEAARYFSNQQP